ETAQALSEARNTATNAISEASTMRQMALPRGESGAKSCRSASSGDTPSWVARGAEQARRALGAGRAGMDAIDRDPMAAELNCQRFCHVHQGGIAGTAAEIAGVAGVAAADVDDAAPARRLHEGNDGAGTAQRSDIFRVEILQQILV